MTGRVVRTPGGVRRTAAAAPSLDVLDDAVTRCFACPRLVAWREAVARERRAAYAHETYWGRPVPGWGDPAPTLLVVGLAPAAHGANRTGRIFTGDRSGDWLFASMHRTGWAAQPTSTHADDGQRLLGARLVAAVRCAPPQNRPTPDERDTCAPWLQREMELVRDGLRAVICLGGFGWAATWRALRDLGYDVPRPAPRFGHGVEVSLPGLTVFGCFHPSQQNTFTGRLTEPMLDAVFARAREVVGS